MPLFIDGYTYYKTKEVCKMVGIHFHTLKKWHDVSEMRDSQGMERLIPKPKLYGKKGIRCWKEEDIELIKEFKDTDKYGKLSTTAKLYDTVQKYTAMSKEEKDYHKVFNFKDYINRLGYVNVRVAIDTKTRMAIILADSNAVVLPYALLEKEDHQGIQRYIDSRLRICV